MINAYLAIGSNLNNPQKQCRRAIDHIRRLNQCTLIKVAPFYSNPAMGRKMMPDYINTVVKIKTRFSPLLLLKKTQALEKKQGRVRRTRWGARTLDIDIILYGKYKMRHPKLVIPHPEYQKRDFVLKPLGQINDSMTQV
jgi:2-amino-4-hydroxy-6-hydroxymethyldihydropteridine diphosphokinase